MKGKHRFAFYLIIMFSFSLVLLNGCGGGGGGSTGTAGTSWPKTWGGDNADDAFGVVVDSDGNIYVTGRTYSFGAGDADVYILKYDNSGNLLWQKTWGGSDIEWSSGISVDGSGNVYVTGRTGSFGAGFWDVFLLKYSSNGNLVSEKTWGVVGTEEGYDVSVDTLGNVYITGTTTNGTGIINVFLLKYDSDLNLLTQKTWDGTGGGTVQGGYSMAIDESNAVYITGYTNSYGAGNEDALLLKYDNLGTFIFLGTWGGSQYDYAEGVYVDSDGNVYMTGFTDSFGAGNYDVFILKADASGNLLWQKTWGGSEEDKGEGISVDLNGNVYVTGYTASFGAGNLDLLLLKYDSNGNLVDEKTWGGGNPDVAYDIFMDLAGSVYMGGWTGNAAGNWQNVTGINTSPAGTSGGGGAIGNQGFPLGNETTPNGTETIPNGSVTYAGGSDSLLMKLTP
ncbi:MAG: SBBP repeat-containing protein [Chloroflexi bacterium]|nr:SBBP repeat-containing protein [Chloroflexota bacterium]